MNSRNALIIIIFAELSLGVMAWYTYGFELEALQSVTRYSGRLSLALFSIIFLFHRHSSLSVEKFLSPHFFLVFAVAHGIHLAELISYVYLSGVVLIPLRLAGGFLAYAMIFAMPVAQRYYEKGKLTEQRFQSLSYVYLYYLWFIFFMTYLPRVQGRLPNVGGSYKEFVILLCWVCLMLGMKISSLLLAKKQQA